MKLSVKGFCLSALVLLAVEASAADYYVSPAGNDINSGTLAKPVRSILKASQLAQPGSTLHFAPGTYSGGMTTTKSGTASARVRYVSDSAWGAKIVGSGTEHAWRNDGDYVDIVGFDISGTGRLGILNMGSFVLIRGNHVHNLTVSGGCTSAGGAGIVNADYTANDNDIIGNVVHDIGTPGGCNGVQGIYHSNLRGHIYNNIVYRVSAYGIHLWHAANKVRIANNTIFANGTSSMGGGIVLGSGDAGGRVIDSTVVANNIVYNNPRSSISEYCYAAANDTCIGLHNVYANNLVSGTGGAITLRKGAATGTISASPQFVNYQANGTGDYHLAAASPAVNAGLAVYAPTTDLDGVTRPQGGLPDIGAYERLATAIEAARLAVGIDVLDVQPNPFTGMLSINLNNGTNQGLSTLTVYDVRGKVVHRSEFTNGRVAWNAEGLPIGAYLVRVRTAQGKQYATKSLLMK